MNIVSRAAVILTGLALAVPALTLTAHAAPTASIAGTLTGPAPTDRIQVVVLKLHSEGFYIPIPRSETGPIPVVEGRYTVAGLEPGTYKLYFADESNKLRSEFWRNAGNIEAAAPIVVNEGVAVTSIDEALDLLNPAASSEAENTRSQLDYMASAVKLVGKARAGKTLKVLTGSPGEVRYRFSWTADGRRLEGRRSALKLTKRLEGKRIAVRVRISNKAGARTRVLTS